MRKSNPITLFVPKLVINEIEIYLTLNPPNFKYHLIYFHYLIYQLTLMQSVHKDDEFYYFDLKHLKKVTISNIDRYIAILRRGQFIISDEKYKPNIKSYKYKINEIYLGNISISHLDTNSKLGKKIIKQIYLKRSHNNRLAPHLKLMYKEFMKMKFDYEGAEKWINKNANSTNELSYYVAINQIRDKRFRYYRRNKTNNRLDTNLTNLKSDLKQFIKGDYVSIDLKNSQPLLLSILIDYILNERDTLCPYLKPSRIIKSFGIKRVKNILNFRLKEEKTKMANFKLFYDSVLKGLLYDDFISLYTKTVKREEIKDIMFKVLFSKNEIYKNSPKYIPYKKEKEVFQSVYHFVYEIIKLLKTNDNRIMPIYLQQFESYIFIDCIAKELVENGIIPFTIHDSMIVEKIHQQKALEIMSEVFLKEISILPTFKVESIKEKT